MTKERTDADGNGGSIRCSSQDRAAGSYSSDKIAEHALLHFQKRINIKHSTSTL